MRSKDLDNLAVLARIIHLYNALDNIVAEFVLRKRQAFFNDLLRELLSLDCRTLHYALLDYHTSIFVRGNYFTIF